MEVKYYVESKIELQRQEIEQYLKDLITRTWSWFVRIESMSFMNCFKFQLLICLSNKDKRSLLHLNCFYCKKEATQVFLTGLVLPKKELFKFTFKRFQGINIPET